MRETVRVSDTTSRQIKQIGEVISKLEDTFTVRVHMAKSLLTFACELSGVNADALDRIERETRIVLTPEQRQAAAIAGVDEIDYAKNLIKFRALSKEPRRKKRRASTKSKALTTGTKKKRKYVKRAAYWKGK